MGEFHFEDPDLKNSTLEIGFPSCAIEKENFIDPQGKPVRTENMESFQAKVQKQRARCVAVAVAILVAKGPYCFCVTGHMDARSIPHKDTRMKKVVAFLA